ncbi:PREDICTED: L-2-hydroxyglutarate dehydrogenase, mitochondrial [Ceratosolen solmsi marchali]|uniref:L-2-hydroxyglutarate dehydrogenase, mitochondrial n=1 Tax=Ceratosolen solmsi marchali TaxID=326594 RepID=A0AAJ7DXG0_9HYME|nr:PREDICTED: L-2-hydroxyglutarate dehydrogenase, mitochondrial [Ceratosolen solmsi marchali]
MNSIFFSTDSCKGYDLVVVGGGIIGCATAREMKIRHPQMRIAIVEKEDGLAKHQTGHNSGVIHAGIYYKPESLKSKLCVEGLKLSYDYIKEKNIPFKQVGKLIVASNDSEITYLNELYERGLKNKCPDIELIDKNCIKNHEPKCTGVKAIWSPWTGIVDWAVVCQHFAEDLKKMGGDIFLNFEVSGIAECVKCKGETNSPFISLYSTNKYLNTKYILTCAGLHSDRLAAITGCDLSTRIVPIRGEYLLIKEDKKNFISTNIYPVPNPKFPFLGVHFTPKLNGDTWIGPNAVVAFAKEGYHWKNINIKDCAELANFSGLYKLCFKHIASGIYEVIKSIFYVLSIKESQRFVPEIQFRDVVRGPAGVRAQALDNNGDLIDDFLFDTGLNKRVIHCRNIPSPGATSSLAIAKFISDKLEKDFKL